jgi:hypothetical protein
MTRRVFNIITDEAGQPITGVPVRIQLNVPTFVAGEQKEIAAWSVETKTDANGRWEVELVPNDLMSDPNSYYKVIEYSHKRRKANEYAIRVPSTGYTEPIHITHLLITPPPVTPPDEAGTGLAADNNALLKGDVRLLAGTGIQLQQDNNAKTITIVNTGNGSGGTDEKVKVFKDGTQIGTVARRLDFRGTGTVDFVVTEDAANDQFDIAANIKSGVITDSHIAANANIAKSKISLSGQWTKAELPSDTVYTADNQELSNKTLVNPTIKDVDATPIANRQLRVVDGEIVATDTTGVEGRYIRDTSIKGTGTLVTSLNADKIDGFEGADLEKVVNKGVANGYAPLDSNAKLPLAHLPSHTHDASEIASGRLSASRLPTSPNANRFLVVRTANSDPIYDTIQASDLPSHTHTKSQITDLETITTTPTANAVPKADTSGKIALGWIPQGSGSNLDADKLDGLDSTAFERVANKGVANGYAPLDANAKLPTTHLPSHASTHASGGSDPITGNLDANARVAVQNSGTLVGTRRTINFIAGTNVSLNITDDSANERVNVTINAVGGGSGVGLDVYPKVLTPGSGWDDTTSAALWEMVTYTNTKQEVLRYPNDIEARRWWEIVVLDAANFAGSFKIIWSSPVAAPSGGDAVVWEVAAGVINSGGSVDPTLTTAAAIGTRAGNEAANIQKETTVTLSLFGVQNGSRIIIRIRRLGNDPNDTLAGDVRLHKVVID